MTIGPELDIVVRAANPHNGPDSPEFAADSLPPVFVDATGRRRRRLRQVAYGVGGAALAYTALLGVSLAGGPVSPYALLPFPELVDRLPAAPVSVRTDKPVVSVAVAPAPDTRPRYVTGGSGGGGVAIPTVVPSTPVTLPAPPGTVPPAPPTVPPAPPPVESTPDPDPTELPVDPTPEPEPVPEPTPEPEPTPPDPGPPPAPAPEPAPAPVANREPVLESEPAAPSAPEPEPAAPGTGPAAAPERPAAQQPPAIAAPPAADEPPTAEPPAAPEAAAESTELTA